MLKGSNNKPRIVATDYDKLKTIYDFFKFYDLIFKTSQGKEFYLIYLAAEKYSMQEIAILTGNSESTLRRHIHIFNSAIDSLINLKVH